MKTAVVILNWNGSEMMRKFLPSVIEYSAGEDREVVVADNASTDDSLDMLAKKFPNIRRIMLDENYGFAEGYNLALAQVDAEYYVLLNSDVEVTPHWLDPLEAYLDEHTDVAACQPKMRSWHHREYFEYAGACGGYLDRYGYPFCRGRIMDTVEMDKGQYDTVADVLWASGAALFIRSIDYKMSGGLDARFFAHMEEIDLCWRLRCRGSRIVCIPQSVVYHVGAATLKRENPMKTFLNFRNNLIMLYKNLPADEIRSVMVIRRMLDYVAALSFICKGQFSNAWTIWRARRQYRHMRSLYKEVRRENLKKKSGLDIAERFKSSILVQYYLKGKKHFSQL
jgi:GT2 family glycosyltransferase